jgi:DtxR family Mn-dependent transcriptional regulator
VHDEAERLEHAVSDELIARMARALGDPEFDPHGAPIPTAEGDIDETELASLAEAPVGSEVVLRQVNDEDAAVLRYLAEEGLTPGVRLRITGRQPFNGPTIVDLAGVPRIIGHELAATLRCVPVRQEEAR